MDTEVGKKNSKGDQQFLHGRSRSSIRAGMGWYQLEV